LDPIYKDLTGNRISNKGAALLASLIWASPTLERLDLSDNNIGDKGAAALAKACRHTMWLEVLLLSKNKIQDFGAFQIARWLTPWRVRQDRHTIKLMTCKLKILRLDGNAGITYVGWNAIAKMAGKNKVLGNIQAKHHYLNVRELNGGDVKLTEVSLRNSMLGDFDAFIVAANLAGNHQLRHVDLSGNSISTMGALAIAECLRTNITLESLKLQDNILGKEGIAALFSALTDANHKLNHLSIGGTEITPAGNGGDVVKCCLRNDAITDLQLNTVSVGSKCRV
jgi:Leucine-rich repeat (LRR) protein